MGMWEAWNREDVAAFGWSAKEVVEKAKEKVKLTDHKSPDVDVEAQRHSPYEESISDQEYGRNDPHDINTKSSKRPQFQGNAEASAKSSNISSPSFPGALPPQLHKKWVWFSLDTKYFHELGFLGAFFQFCGATIFWISGYGFWKHPSIRSRGLLIHSSRFTAIPTILSALENNTAALNGAFWSPQVIGGSGFIISSWVRSLDQILSGYI